MTRHHSDKCAFMKGRKNECDCDGYHTFEELYEHRIALFCALGGWYDAWPTSLIWKSKKHSDGTEWDGWFIAGIDKDEGLQITYHIPISHWKKFSHFTTLRKAPKWDGHTPDDVIKRLYEL